MLKCAKNLNAQIIIEAVFLIRKQIGNSLNYIVF